MILCYMEVITAMDNIVTNDRGPRLKSNRNITIYPHYRYITRFSPILLLAVLYGRKPFDYGRYMTDQRIDLTIFKKIINPNRTLTYVGCVYRTYKIHKQNSGSNIDITILIY